MTQSNRKGTPFPKEFPQHVRLIWKLLFRALAHIYACHYDEVLSSQSESHLNTIFTHFVCFAREFDLLEKREYESMEDLIGMMDQRGVFH